jgi:hypothetical protein
MKEIVLKLIDENVLREWFEAGIAFNLIFGYILEKIWFWFTSKMSQNPLALRLVLYNVLGKHFILLLYSLISTPRC